MKVIVLGAGVIGVSTAHALARAGHEVTVIERQPGAALETSYANAGEVSPGYSAPWAAPGMIVKAVKWLTMTHRPLVVWPSLDARLWAWSLRLLANCNAEAYDRNKGRMLRLAEYSRDCLRDLRAQTGIRYDERTQGTLQVFRRQKQLDAAAADMAILDKFRVPYQLLDQAGCVKYEPALARVRGKIVGGLRLPGDETGDCYQFTNALVEIAKGLGVSFRFDTAIEAIKREGYRIVGIQTDKGELKADAYVVALGSYSPLLLRPLGIRIPVYPVKGYSITVPITDPAGAPESTVMDETHKVAVTRLGDRIRAGGTAELAGYNLCLRSARKKTLDFVVSDLFGGGGDVAKGEFWTGLRPMTPDGTPVVGPTPYSNLFLNTGHGTLGWTMAAGSARVVADAVAGRVADIDLAGLTLQRYASGGAQASLVREQS